MAVGRRPQFLAGFWQKVSVLALQASSWGCSQHDIWVSPEWVTQDRARLQDSSQNGSLLVFDNLFLKVTSQCFYHILFVTQSKPSQMWMGTVRGHEHYKAGIAGGHFGSILGLICLHNRVRQFLTINLFMLIERTLINTMYTSLCKCSVTVRATGERILSDALRQHLRVQTNTVASYNSQQKKLRASLTLQSLYFLKFRKGTCIKSVQNTLCSLV